MDDFGAIAVDKFFAPRARNNNEAIATFRTVAIRDTVRASSNKLAAYGQQAGIRIHVPGFLLGSFQVLENLGYQMRQSDPDTRRSIKFEDDKMDLMMDIRDHGVWKRIRPADARDTTVASIINLKPSGPPLMTGSNIADFFNSRRGSASGGSASGGSASGGQSGKAPNANDNDSNGSNSNSSASDQSSGSGDSEENMDI